MQPMLKTSEPSERGEDRLQAVDRVDEARTPINPFATAILIVISTAWMIATAILIIVATAWMIALFALAMRVAAQLI